jgi:predicted dehydrogenase
MLRRDFIRSGAFVAGSVMAPFPLFANAEKIKLAVLGTGWWAMTYLMPNALRSGHFEIVGLCDINSVNLNAAADLVVKAGGKKPRLFASYEEMYNMPGLQALIISTPTHWHALHFIAACKKGLDVFQEKPLSYDIREGQAMIEAHHKAGNVVQIDFPRVMVDTNDQVKAYIDSGEAGKIYQVQANINNFDAVLVEKPVPATIDFETFCGPAPHEKYLCSANADNPNWRGQHGFSRGIMVDWGIHYIHNARKVLNLGLPDKVSAVGGTTRNFTQSNPDHLTALYDFGGLPVYWEHKSWGFTSNKPDNNIGIFYYGDKATIFAGDLGWEVYPVNGCEKISHGDVTFNPNKPSSVPVLTKVFVDMFTELAEGIRNKSNSKITNKIEDAQVTTSTVIYGDLAFRTKSAFSIDKTTMNTPDNNEVSALLKREYRVPYKHPWVG